MVPGWRLRKGSGLRSRTLNPRACSSAPSAADASPLPSEETTPPVMKTYRAMGLDHIPKRKRVVSPNSTRGATYHSHLCETLIATAALVGLEAQLACRVQRAPDCL